MTKGIVIIATRSHIYGYMAYNLALTIKATGSKIPVTLIHDSEAIVGLRPENLKMFDETIATDLDWNKIRFNIDKISPYYFTLQLDADMLWLWRDPELLFEQYKDAELLVTNEGYYDIEDKKEFLTGKYSWLADPNETIRLYKLKSKLYQMRWELLLFKKTETVRKMFAKAEAIRKNPKLKTWQFEGQTVDEFCFYVAACINKLDQLESPFLPAYWLRRQYNHETIAEYNEKYYALSFGGNIATKEYKRMYDIVMQVACRKMNLPYEFHLTSKRNYIKERIAV